MLRFSIACFGVRVSVAFHLMCVHINLSSVWVVEGPLFGKQLLTRLTICSLCILIMFNFLVLRAGFGFLLPQLLVFAYFSLFSFRKSNYVNIKIRFR